MWGRDTKGKLFDSPESPSQEKACSEHGCNYTVSGPWMLKKSGWTFIAKNGQIMKNLEKEMEKINIFAKIRYDQYRRK
jgi:hypothetical protein